MLSDHQEIPAALPAKHAPLFGWILLSVWSAALLLITHGASLFLPFMADDFFHFPFVDEHTFSEIWQTAEGLYYFRPVAFAYWKIAESFFGAHNPFFLHASNLIVHWINALLTGWLAAYLWRTSSAWDGWLRSFLTASLFIVYPFSYEAIPWVGAFMHPLVTTLVLLTIIGYMQLRDKGSIAWGAAGLICAFLAPFTHENGAVIFLLLAAVEVTRPDGGGRSRRQRLILLGLWIIPLFLWFLIWRLEPRTVGTGGLGINSLAVMVRNSIYLLQAAAYPLTWFSVPIIRQLPLTELPATALISVVALTAAAWIQRRGGGDRRSLLPWFWALLASLPAIAFLSFSYLQAAPRVLTLASVGIVWLWVDVIVLLPKVLRRSMQAGALPTLLSAGLFCLILSQSIFYVRLQMRTYEAGGALIWDMIEKTMAANDADQIAVFTNLPTWLALPRSHFALGEEGAMLMPTATNMSTLVTTHTGQPARILPIEHAATRQDMPFYHGIVAANPDWEELAAEGAQVFTTRYAPDILFAQPAGMITDTRDLDADAPLARFGECLTLQDAGTIYADGNLEIELTWRQTCGSSAELTAFVHILDEHGRLLTQADGDPLAGILPFAEWPEDVIVHDKRFADSEIQPVNLAIGLYDRYSGERAPVRDAADAPYLDEAVLIPLK